MTLGRTPSQTVGPFFSIALTTASQNELVPGGELRILGRVLDGAGEPVPDAVVELWQRRGDDTLWGRCGTDAQGRFDFTTERPHAPEGEAPHAHLMVFARGLLRHLVTRLYLPDEARNASDPTLAALPPAERDTLVARREDGTLRFDVRLQGDEATVFFAV